MLKQKSLISLITNISINIIGMFSSIIVARYMGPEPLGVLSTSQAFVNMFGIIGGLGFGIAHFKRVSEGMDLGKCNGTFFTIRAILSLLMFAMIMITFYAIGWLTGNYILPRQYIIFFWIIAIGFTLSNISQSIQLTFSARLEVAKNGLILISQKLLNTILKILVAILGLSTIYLAWGDFIGVLFSILVALLLFKRYPISKFDRTTFKSYLTFAAPMTIVQFIETGAIYLDKVFLGYFISAEEVGYYIVAQSLSNVLLMTAWMFINLLVPVFSNLHKNGKIEEMVNLSKRVYRLISLIFTPVLVYIFFYAGDIVEFLYGKQFERSILILQIFTIYILFYYYLQPFVNLVTGSDKPKQVALFGGIAAFLNIILNLLLIPNSLFGYQLFGLGAIGAAIALLISIFIRFFLFRLYIFKVQKIGFNPNISIHLGLSILLLMTISYLTDLLNLIPITSLILSSTIFFVFYFGFLILVKNIGRSDFLFVVDIFNLKKLKSSIKGDFKD